MIFEDHPNVVMNTHATFRWRHGLFPAFDFDQIDDFNPNLFICLVDNIEVVHDRLHAEHDIDATLKDCMVWREEEILATELMAQACGCRNSFYVLSRGRHQDTTETCYRLIARNNLKKVYPSFPMSHVVDMPDILEEIDQFRAALAEHFISFDPIALTTVSKFKSLAGSSRRSHFAPTTLMAVTPTNTSPS